MQRGSPSREEVIEGLRKRARALGATAAAVIPAATLVVEDRFAALCAAPHRCPGYGLAPGCPPHAMQPYAFRDRLLAYQQVLVFKIDVPAAVLMGKGRLEIARAIHCLAAALEQEALDQGIPLAWGLAAGSCKELFCAQEEVCVVLAQRLPCPHAGQARPSLSALGVHFTLLAESVGWQLHTAREGDLATASDEPAMSLMAGMVLLA